MKCPKCQKENLDDNVYCMYCGEKMISPQEGKECPYCHEQIPEDSKFCSFCGKGLEDKVYCPKCGEENNNDEKFCKNCHCLLKKEDFNIENEVIKNKVEGKYDDSSLALSIAALTLIIIACFMPIISNVAAIILGIIALIQAVKSNNSPKANAAKIISIIAIVINSLYLIASICAYLSPEENNDNFETACQIFKSYISSIVSFIKH